jgi:hypothetical protein
MSGTQYSKAARVAAHLRDLAAESDGPLYVKSRFVAEDMTLSAKEIGAVMGDLDEQTHGLAVEPWAYSGGTTWRVALADEPTPR